MHISFVKSEGCICFLCGGEVGGDENVWIDEKERMSHFNILTCNRCILNHKKDDKIFCCFKAFLLTITAVLPYFLLFKQNIILCSVERPKTAIPITQNYRLMLM